MKALAELIRGDMKIAYGVTEPGAIAYACAKAHSLCGGKVSAVELAVNSGIYKNAFTCAIPGTKEKGNGWAAALGAVAGDAEKQLAALDGLTARQIAEAGALIESGAVTVKMQNISPVILIDATVKTENGVGRAVIEHTHTSLTLLQKNGETVFQAAAEQAEDDPCEEIKARTLEELVDYAKTVPIEELAFLREAFSTDLALYEEGKKEGKTPITQALIDENDGRELSRDLKKSMSIFACGPIEARATGAAAPAMSITGSGSHGIIAMMPLYAAGKVLDKTEEEVLRAVCLSCLVTIYIKEYSGRLSALCGCALAGGTGTACGLVLLRGGEKEQIAAAVGHMAASLTGMICHGGNHGCALKALAAVQLACDSAMLALRGVEMEPCHSILGSTPELTMQNIGYIASPGMSATEETIVEIMETRKTPRAGR